MALRDDSSGGAVRAPEEGHQRTVKVGPRKAARRAERELPSLEDDRKDAFAKAQAFYEAGKYNQAWAIVNRQITHGAHDDPRFLITASQIYDKEKNFATAYQYAKRVTEIAPQYPDGWLNLGYIQEQLYLFDGAEYSYQRGLSVARTDEQKGLLRLNWASCLITKGDFEAAEDMARQALRYTPESKKAQANLGFALLGQRKWAEGWKLYNAIVGYHDNRRSVSYVGEPTWEGQPGKKVVVYGEQGLGDEISFASMYPDAIKRAGKVIIDCEPRLAGLFRRSFPGAKVYGTLKLKAPGWDVADTHIDASITSAGLGGLFRATPESFDGKPYLVADPDRVAMWEGLFSKQERPVIGIAWSGGVAHTAERYRRLELEELLPVFQSVDAVWISLQYKDAGREIADFKADHPEIDLRQYPFGTLTQDYDDTAALVASLDHVVTMQTTIVHLAGGLGVSTQCLVNRCGQWRYGVDCDDMPWYSSVKLYRQSRVGEWPLDRLVADLPGYL